jgi:hyperosmotically inducible periplasmic protein
VADYFNSQHESINMNTRAFTAAMASAISVAAISLTLPACADLKITPAGPVPDTKIMAQSVAAAGPTDAMLVDTVRAELSKHASLKTGDLKILVKNGEVTLNGVVETGQQLAKIATIVQKVSGVKAVIPDVEVKS